MSKRSEGNKRGSGKGPIIFMAAAFAVFFAAFCVGAYMLIPELLSEKKAAQAFDELAAQVSEAREAASGTQQPDAMPAPQEEIQNVQQAWDTPVPEAAAVWEPADDSSAAYGSPKGSGAGETLDDSASWQEPAAAAWAASYAEAQPLPEAETAPNATRIPVAAVIPAATPTPEPAILPMYAGLYEQNSDLFGWIEIEDTNINYPVMYTPEEPEYYLHRLFDRSDAPCGVPFMDGYCYPGCGNYIIYGHHMKNGLMFAQITEYEKQDFWQEHPIIRFDMLYETGEYEVIGAFYSQAYPKEAVNVFRYYNYKDVSDPEVFEEYVAKVKKAALYDTGIEPVYGDQLITLSTCEYQTLEGRFVVVAKKR